MSSPRISDKIANMDEQGAEIKEVHSSGGSGLDRAINKVLGFGSPKEYTIPSFLDQEIKESSEISLFLKGSKENLQVSCKTPRATLSLNDLAPENTTFAINKSNMAGWEVFEGKNKVLVPSNLELLRIATIYGPIHEISHLWEKEVPEWVNETHDAKNILGEKIKQNIVLNLPSNPIARQKETDAWKVIEKSERRATEIGLYIIGKLRSFGIDILPNYPDTQSLFAMTKYFFASHRQFNHEPFLIDDAKSLIDGNLPYLDLKGKIDARIVKTLEASLQTTANK